MLSRQKELSNGKNDRKERAWAIPHAARGRQARIGAARGCECPQPPVCIYEFGVTDERRATPDKRAVMKKGRKSAVRVLDSEEEAQKLAMDDKALSYGSERASDTTDDDGGAKMRHCGAPFLRGQARWRMPAGIGQKHIKERKG